MLESHGVGLVFIGEGAMKKEIQAAAQNCRSIRFMPFFPVSQIPAVMAAGDLHVVTIKRGLEGVVVPSKLFNIFCHCPPNLAIATQKTHVTCPAQPPDVRSPPLPH